VAGANAEDCKEPGAGDCQKVTSTQREPPAQRDTFYVRTSNTPDSAPRKRFEIAARGIDDSLQGIGSDPYGGISWVGLRVPAHVNLPSTRYLFQLATFDVAHGKRARIVGMRNGWSIGERQGDLYVNEFWVENPIWKFIDGNVSWHLRRMPLNYPMVQRAGPIVPALQNFAFETSNTAALLYKTAAFAGPTGFYTTLTDYAPPNAGMPWGSAIGASLGTFNDLKVRWNDGADWHALDIPVEGPCRIALYASVLQTNPDSEGGRTKLSVPGRSIAAFPLGLSAEEQFLQNFPAAIIWRVAGGLMVEEEDYKP
jgi:hypothetical protein